MHTHDNVSEAFRKYDFRGFHIFCKDFVNYEFLYIIYWQIWNPTGTIIIDVLFKDSGQWGRMIVHLLINNNAI